LECLEILELTLSNTHSGSLQVLHTLAHSKYKKKCLISCFSGLRHSGNLTVLSFTASRRQNSLSPASGFRSSSAGPGSFACVPAVSLRFLPAASRGLSCKRSHSPPYLKKLSPYLSILLYSHRHSFLYTYFKRNPGAFVMENSTYFSPIT